MRGLNPGRLARLLQEQYGLRYDVMQSTIQRLVKGKQARIDSDKWAKICMILNVNPVTGQESPRKDTRIRQLPDGPVQSFTIAFILNAPEGEYEISDPSGETARVTLRVTMGLPALVFHAPNRGLKARKVG